MYCDLLAKSWFSNYQLTCINPSAPIDLQTPWSKSGKVRISRSQIDINLIFQALRKMLVKANAMHATETNGESLSPMIAAFLTEPLKPWVYCWLIIVGFHALRYEHVQMKSTTTIRNASKLNRADYGVTYIKSCQNWNTFKKSSRSSYDLMMWHLPCFFVF